MQYPKAISQTHGADSSPGIYPDGIGRERKGFYAVVDCNSFYCSAERVFRPELAEKPVVVLSNNDGCIVSRTDEVKRLGVEMAIPYLKQKK